MRNVGRVLAAITLTALLAWSAAAQDKPAQGKPKDGAQDPGEAGVRPIPVTSAPAEGGSSEVGELPAAKPKKPGDKLTERNVEVSSLSLKGDTVIFPGDYKGKVVLIHVWGTWCPHCKEELSTWKRAFKTFDGDSFGMLGIITDANRNRTLEEAQKFVTDSKVEWTQVFQDGPQIAANLGVKSLPFVIVCDGDTGEILVRGDELRGKKLYPLLRTLIAAKVASKNKSTGATAAQPAPAPKTP